jgi:hypothetical protein
MESRPDLTFVASFSDLADAVAQIPSTLALEEVHFGLLRSSPRNEFIEPSRWSAKWNEDRAALMFRHLSTFASLTVLRLTGQFCIPVDFFGALTAANENPFPALRSFHLDIRPDTSDGG